MGPGFEPRRGHYDLPMGIGFGFGLGPLRFYVPLVRGGRRRRAKYWTHPNCTIHHRSEDAANRCKVGRAAIRPTAIAHPAPVAAQRDWGAFDHADVKQMVRAAAELVISTQYGSVAMLQRRLRIGFKDATDIMGILENLKVVGPADGSATRSVLVPASAAETVLEFVNENVDIERQKTPGPDSIESGPGA